MKIRKKGYWGLFTLTLVFAFLALTTLMPYEGASEDCYLGYKATCSFSPFSTILMAIPAGIVCFIRKRFFVTYQ